MAFFAWWNVWPLVVLSVVGLLVWVLAMVSAKRGRVQLNMALIYGTASTWTAAAVVFVGWGFGAQYVLIAQMIVTILNPWPRRMAWLLASALVGLFILLYHYTRLVSPLYDVPEGQLAIANTLNIVATFGVACLLVAYPARVADRAEAELAAEHRRSERLLTNVLPLSVARRLKAGEEPIADRVSSASVLFADIVDFTPLASRLPAEQVVTVLDSVFTRLDRLVDEYGLEKIKTIGDAYMVAAGLPSARADHAQAIARFALAALDDLAKADDPAPRLQLRIGIASGPVVAGVIGRRRFLYDLWGDTVNTAARMESHGLPGRIQVTESTRQLLGDEFDCKERGFVDIKGKGQMRTYLLEAA
ncbi:adenylate/guanylate cyclase domain-containing protein [Intrasporangium sp.]|uniref:adenylate/guanylate cyclase domain-containing protein n=1 Tax=Intrasporangium sp. TaxID=1925024 RepID=UPI003365B269